MAMSTWALYPIEEIQYPDSDGKPVAESDFQFYPLIYAAAALRRYFQDRDDVYVAGNMFLYYEEGNPKAVVAPDVFVVLGAPKHKRFSYQLWREPKAPDFVLEITSRSTRSEDQGVKKGVYAFLGVQEYWQYDPTRDYLNPPLQGFRLVAGNYQRLPGRRLPGGGLALRSEVLGLELRLEGDELRFYDPITQQRLPNYEEAEEARRTAEESRREAEARAQQEAALRQAAETRLAELEAQLRALRGKG